MLACSGVSCCQRGAPGCATPWADHACCVLRPRPASRLPNPPLTLLTSAEDEGPAAAAKQQQQGRTYAQEQEELKKAFLSAFEEEAGAEGQGGDGFGSGVLQARKKKGAAAAAEGSDTDDEAAGMGGDGAGEESEAAAAARVQQLLDGYFGRDEQLSADDRFLKRYILNKVGRGLLGCHCCFSIDRLAQVGRLGRVLPVGSWLGCLAQACFKPACLR